MTHGKRPWGLAAGGVAVGVVVIGGMAVATRAARWASGGLRAAMASSGPPVTAASLPSALGGVPVPPFMALDETATNDPATCLVVGLTMGNGRGMRALVFASPRPLENVAAWYQGNLHGWTRATRRTRRRHNNDDPISTAAFTRQNRRITLVSLPQYPGKVILLLSTRSAP